MALMSKKKVAFIRAIGANLIFLGSALLHGLFFDEFYVLPFLVFPEEWMALGTVFALWSVWLMAGVLSPRWLFQWAEEAHPARWALVLLIASYLLGLTLWAAILFSGFNALIGDWRII